MPPAAAASHDEIGEHYQHNQLPYESDEDEAGYQAMMSDLPAIVTISGLLDGDFDELNEIKNLLNPVSDDDDEAAAIIASKEKEEEEQTKKVSSSSYSFQVPNPIPDRVPNPIPTWSTSTTVAPKRIRQESSTAFSSHKKSKLASGNNDTKPKTPANVRTSANGIPNPLLFGQSTQLQVPTSSTTNFVTSTANLHANNSQQKKPEEKVKLSAQKQTAAKTMTPKDKKLSLGAAAKSSMEAKKAKKSDPKEGPKLKQGKQKAVDKKQVTKSSHKPKNCLIQIPHCFPVPPLPEPVHNRAPLCKVTFKAKMESSVANTESAIAKVEAPRLKAPEAQANIPAKQPVKDNKSTKKHSISATTSTAKKPQQTKKATKKATVVKVKKAPVKATVSAAKPPASVISSKNIAVKVEPKEVPKQEKPSEDIKTKEKFLVANPLANVPRDPPKLVPSSTGAASKSTSNSSAVVNSNGAMDPAGQQQLPTSQPKSFNRARTPAERAKACRDRNRQHARNTRLRKKAYVEELKRSLVIMAEERDKLLAEKQHKVQTVEARKQMMQDFMRLRGRHHSQEQDWNALLHDPKTFTLTLPVTGFQTMVESDGPSNGASANTEQVLVGIQDVMADSKFFASFLQTLGTNDAMDEGDKPTVDIRYDFDENQFFLLDRSTGILNWYATSSGAIAQGAKSEISLGGTFRAQFSPVTNKLVSGILMFDTRAVTEQ